MAAAHKFIFIMYVISIYLLVKVRLNLRLARSIMSNIELDFLE